MGGAAGFRLRAITIHAVAIPQPAIRTVALAVDVPSVDERVGMHQVVHAQPTSPHFARRRANKHHRARSTSKLLSQCCGVSETRLLSFITSAHP